MTPRRWVRIAIAITLGAALATLPALPAASQPVPSPLIVDIQDATLAARGAALLVTVTVTCPAGVEFAQVSVSVSQRRGSRIASGEGAVSSFACTGEPQEVIVPVQASDTPFKQGVAFATANLVACFPFGFCGSVVVSEEITIFKADTAAAA